jgi:hypothetical protein
MGIGMPLFFVWFVENVAVSLFVANFLVTLYSQIRLSSIRLARWGVSDDLTVSFLFEGRSCDFSTEHGFMLVGLGNSMWFRDLVGTSGNSSSDSEPDSIISPAAAPPQWNRCDITLMHMPFSSY